MRKKWERLIVAYDGEVRDSETSGDTTHRVMCGEEVSMYSGTS